MDQKTRIQQAQASLGPIERDDNGNLVITVRAVSARLIRGHWQDLPADVLKAAAAGLKGVPVLTDHNRSAWSVCGMVIESWWDNTLIDGAPGINAKLRLQTWDVPRGLLNQMRADPPLKVPVSVSFDADWLKSHDLADDDFDEALGHVIDGQTVRMIAERIADWHEISLVYAGADPAAGQLSAQEPNDNKSPKRSESMDKKTVELQALAPVATALGVSLDSGDAVQLIADKATALAGQVAELTPLAEAGRTHLDARRAEATRLAAMAADDNQVPESVTNMIGKADLATVEGLITSYGGKAATTFSGTCPHCGKGLAAMRSSMEPGGDGQASFGARGHNADRVKNLTDKVNARRGVSNG